MTWSFGSLLTSAEKLSNFLQTLPALALSSPRIPPPQWPWLIGNLSGEASNANRTGLWVVNDSLQFVRL